MLFRNLGVEGLRGLGFRVLGIRGLGFRVEDLGFRVLGFMAYYMDIHICTGFRVAGVDTRVQIWGTAYACSGNLISIHFVLLFSPSLLFMLNFLLRVGLH